MSSEVRYATLGEVAERWGVPVSWLYERSRRNELPGQRRLGRHIRIDLNEFEQKVKEGILADTDRGGQGAPFSEPPTEPS